ncbi:nitroreductase family protein [Sulfurovum sp. zt1-1]|uniref:Nitroreductase family protein n=1 Tax=Sulfurovum zhangzhouensis TaxID=3019067 RepID=A0ABT7QVJ5_9BACT|nr:nitroreductase family protein [Sulfurovum zhangzhouensis]MDM5270817.1 nitroreductase family protein [Sulfurovum zhangzhouensis]
MQAIYNDTILTPLRVAKTTRFLDWNTQPSQFKNYPDFLYRYDFNEVEALKLVELSRCVTEFSKINGKPYYRLNTPSAGNLHPLELYVQIRGIKGVISGIYHVNPKDETMVLIREIETDGIEGALGISERFRGMIFLISLVPFRSEWKYADRAIRYCYLDAGHQLGAIMASAQILGQKCTVLSEIDRECLDQWMGFPSEEFSCLAVAIGEKTEKSVTPLKQPLIQVPAVDYIEGNLNVPSYLSGLKYDHTFTMKEWPSLTNSDCIYGRRSARYFIPNPLSAQDSRDFLALLANAPECMEIFCIVHRSEALDAGIYTAEGCISKGAYQQTVSHLMVEQHFIANAAIVMVMTAKVFSSEALMHAGAFVHQLQLFAQEKGIGCTGIGAFYDKKVQTFLNTENTILYACAIGEV